MQYWKSELGEKAYKAIEKAYPTHPFDEAYSIFLRKTKSSKDNETIITKMIRLKLPSEEGENDEEGKQVILYDCKEVRRDGLGNKKSYVRLNLGKYPIPEKIMQMGYDEDYQPIAKVVGIGEVNMGYEFPFTVEKADELHRWCKDKITATNTKKTEYIVQKMGEMKISVDSFKSWRNGDFEVLYQFGNAEGVEKTIVRPKTKKSKEHEQAELQREVLRKPYTTIKPKEEEKQEDKVVTAEASVV